MIKKNPLGATSAALGCGALMIFFAAFFGIVISFLADDPKLAFTIRTRCVIGLLIGIAMIIARKIIKARQE
jgi:carbon starvation protein CstA